jgi:hypothetical protein
MMIQKLLLTSWAIIGSVLAKGIPVCTEQNEWLGANMTTFQEPITDDISSFIFIDSPATISTDNSTCECAPVFGVVSYSMANGTWTWDDTVSNCTLTCDRCQIYYCVYQFQDSLNNDFNVTFAEDGSASCVLPIEVTTTTTEDVPTSTTEVVTTTEEVSIEVEIHYMEGNTTTNYTLEYPVPTVVVTDTLDTSTM